MTYTEDLDQLISFKDKLPAFVKVQPDKKTGTGVVNQAKLIAI